MSEDLPSFAVFDLSDQLSVDAHRLRVQQENTWRDLDRQRAELILHRERLGQQPDGTSNDWYVLEYYVRYDLASGDILGSGKMSRAAIREEDRLFEGDGYLIVDRLYDIDADYLDLRTMTVKPRDPCFAHAENRDGNPYWLVNLPLPCTIRITDEGGDTTEFNVATEEVELDFEGVPGVYTVTVLSARCLDGVYTFEVPA